MEKILVVSFSRPATTCKFAPDRHVPDFWLSESPYPLRVYIYRGEEVTPTRTHIASDNYIIK